MKIKVWILAVTAVKFGYYLMKLACLLASSYAMFFIVINFIVLKEMVSLGINGNNRRSEFFIRHTKAIPLAVTDL